MRTIVCRGLHWGTVILGNYHIFLGLGFTDERFGIRVETCQDGSL